MRTLLRWSDTLFLVVASIFSACYFLCVVIQVVYRYVLEMPISWTEETARYLFVWAALLAAAVSVGRNDQFNIPILADQLGPRARRWLELVIVALGFAFAMVMVIYGYRTSARLFYAISPVIPISQGAVYLVIPIAGAYMAVHLAWRFVGLIAGRIDPTRTEQTEGSAW
jgi:TRAP-type C4-dicarboxylate transport system permease small subunit